MYSLVKETSHPIFRTLLRIVRICAIEQFSGLSIYDISIELDYFRNLSTIPFPLPLLPLLTPPYPLLSPLSYLYLGPL